MKNINNLKKKLKLFQSKEIEYSNIYKSKVSLNPELI